MRNVQIEKMRQSSSGCRLGNVQKLQRMWGRRGPRTAEADAGLGLMVRWRVRGGPEMQGWRQSSRWGLVLGSSAPGTTHSCPAPSTRVAAPVWRGRRTYLVATASLLLAERLFWDGACCLGLVPALTFFNMAAWLLLDGASLPTCVLSGDSCCGLVPNQK